MFFAYEDLGDDQFEKLVVLISQKLFGIGVQGFTKGPDGGRDAKFIGTAELFPSKSEPWKGITIIQAKHTNGINKSFSEKNFFNPSSKSAELSVEINRIKKLKSQNDLDNYLLVSNRRLSGNTDKSICRYIHESCDIPLGSIHIMGIDDINLYLRQYPDIVENANIDPIDSPLTVTSFDLADVIEAIARHKNDIKNVVDVPPTQRIDHNSKNKSNNMSDEYAKELRNKYLKEVAFIQSFFSSPENHELLQMYESVVEEFQLKIIAKRKRYQSFDEVMNYLTDLLLKRDPILNQHNHKRLTRAILFYMYWHCDIGVEDDSKAN